MKFTLTYEGELRANDDYRRKWDIRKQLHPQLVELWRVEPSLQMVKKHRQIPAEGYWKVETHHTLSLRLMRT
jgi:hypothetical protein